MCSATVGALRRPPGLVAGSAVATRLSGTRAHGVGWRDGVQPHLLSSSQFACSTETAMAPCVVGCAWGGRADGAAASVPLAPPSLTPWNGILPLPLPQNARVPGASRAAHQALSVLTCSRSVWQDLCPPKLKAACASHADCLSADRSSRGRGPPAVAQHAPPPPAPTHARGTPAAWSAATPPPPLPPPSEVGPAQADPWGRIHREGRLRPGHGTAASLRTHTAQEDLHFSHPITSISAAFRAPLIPPLPMACGKHSRSRSCRSAQPFTGLSVLPLS